MPVFSKILSSIDEAVWSFDLHKRKFIYVNNRLGDIYETSISSLEKNQSFWLNYIHPDDYQYVAIETNRVFEGENIDIEYRLIVQQKIKWVRDKKVLVNDPNGNNLIITGILADITEKKLYEDNLTESEKTFRYLFINNPNPLWIYDRETLAFLDVNNAAITKYGYSKHEFLSMTIADIRPPEDVPMLKESVRGIRAHYYHSGTVWRHLKKSGEIIYVDISGHGIKHRGRNAELVMAHDITGQIKNQQKITLAKENLDALINNIEDNIWSIDSEYKLMSANISFKVTLGEATGREILIGESIFMPEFEEKDKVLWKRYYDRALNGEAFSFIELVNFPKCPSFFSETKLNPIRLNDEIIGVACISSNIQERLEAQKKIMEHNKKLLELISIASHEIRGPVASLLGLADVFNTKDYADPFNMEIVNLIKSTTKQLDELIHTLVDKTYALQQENQIKYIAQQNRSGNE